MDRATLAPRIDHTVLGPATTQADVRAVLDQASEYGTNACIPPCYVAEAREWAPDLTLVTVVGFPQGTNHPGTKAGEAETAWTDGADELDVVISVGRLKAGQDDRVSEDLESVVAAVPLPVKAIIEAPLLTDDETHRACELARDADAAFLKTATGFVDGGATTEDVALMSDYLPVKASGGIGTYEEAIGMIDAGADRIGSSSGVAILEAAPTP